MMTSVTLGFAALLWAPQDAIPEGVTSIDVFGARTVEAEAIREASGLVLGEPISERIVDIEARVAALPGVISASVSPIVYPGNRALFIGVVEEGAAKPTYRDAPTGDARVPAEVMRVHQKAMSLVFEGIHKGQASEDTSEGHSISRYPPAREEELKLPGLAEEYFLDLVDALRESSSAEHRAAAASVLAYADDKAEVATELQFAVTDPDPGVRNDAVRALGILATYANANPDLGLEIDPAPFLQLIQSPTWTDRNKGAATLAGLTQSRDPELMKRLCAECLECVAEMARWRSRGHSGFSVTILGRMAGASDDEIRDADNRMRADATTIDPWVDAMVAKVRAAGEGE